MCSPLNQQLPNTCTNCIKTSKLIVGYYVGGEGSTINRTRGTDTAYFTYGRFQPPHIGHEALITELMSLAAEAGADHYIFVHSADSDVGEKGSRRFSQKNPLSIYQRVYYMRQLFPKASIVNTEVQQCPGFKDIYIALRKKGYKNYYVVVGTDREKLFNKVFGKLKTAHIITFHHKSPELAATRATDLRQAAADGNFRRFESGVLAGNMNESLAIQLYNDVRRGLGLEVSTSLDSQAGLTTDEAIHGKVAEFSVQFLLHFDQLHNKTWYYIVAGEL